MSCWVDAPSPGVPMLSVFIPAEASLKKAVAADLSALPETAVWIDLVKPTAAEDRAVERLAGIAVPTREDMQEIEISSRLYMENSARYMTATLMCAADTQNPRTTAVTFILASHRLVTVRYDEPKPFMLVENKLARRCAPRITGEMVLLELLDAVLGVVNLEQNNIIKLFSVMAVVLMPPTLIASIYGMNFKVMPELEWVHGYPMALVMMLLAAVLPYLFFTWKKWL